jgi:prolipoprotein diacylglyceryltransferase
MEFTLLWQAGLGVLAAVVVARFQSRRGLVPRDPGLGDRLVGAVAVGVLSGRLAAMIVQGVNPVLAPADVLVVRGGVHTGAASLAALATLAWGLRSNLWRGLDGAAPAALAGLAGWHAGCVFRDACLGTVSRLPWALAQPGSTITRHPVELYAAGLYALAAAGALWVGRRWTPGLLTGLALAVAALARLVTQPLRPSLGSGPIGWYLAGTVIGLLVAILRYRSTAPP